MEVNQDVLLGKKTTTCLSCNNGKEGFDKFFSVRGKDGKIYYGGIDHQRSNSLIKKTTTRDESERVGIHGFDLNLKSTRESPRNLNASVS